RLKTTDWTADSAAKLLWSLARYGKGEEIQKHKQAVARARLQKRTGDLQSVHTEESDGLLFQIATRRVIDEIDRFPVSLLADIIYTHHEIGIKNERLFRAARTQNGLNLNHAAARGWWYGRSPMTPALQPEESGFDMFFRTMAVVQKGDFLRPSDKPKPQGKKTYDKPQAPERTQKGQRWLSRSELAELIQTLRKAVPQYYPAARKAEDAQDRARAQCVVLGRDVFHLQSGLHDQKENRELLRHVEGWKDLGGPKALEAPSPASPPASPPALPPKTPQTPKTSASPAGPAFSPPKTAEKRPGEQEEDPAAKKSGGAHCNRAITLEAEKTNVNRGEGALSEATGDIEREGHLQGLLLQQ
ncbi:unnamed protein product, partial [Durusdinium trenchii]